MSSKTSQNEKLLKDIHELSTIMVHETDILKERINKLEEDNKNKNDILKKVEEIIKEIYYVYNDSDKKIHYDKEELVERLLKELEKINNNIYEISRIKDDGNI